MTTWGEVYRARLAKGEDHGSAAYVADLWQKRQDQRTEQNKVQAIERAALKRMNILNSQSGKQGGSGVASRLEQNLASAKAHLAQALHAIDRSTAHKDCPPHTAAVLKSAGDHASRAVGFIARAIMSL